tara:strand:+ start:6859 stop:8703 length:1845 start_codon:yes stop_codon:yes gene_type:complete
MTISRKIIDADGQPDGGSGIVSGAGSKGLTPSEKLNSNNKINAPETVDQSISEINSDLQDRYDHENYYGGDSDGGNTAPVANNNASSVNNDSDTGASVIIDVLANDTDAEGNTLTINSFTQPSNGTVTQVGQTLQYQADAGYDGSDSFTYDCTDGTIVSNTATVNMTVNLRPGANNDAGSVNNDTKTGGSVIIDVLANDTVAAGKTLTINSFTQPTNGTVTQVGQTLQYQANAGYHGSDSFTYDCTDGTLTSTSTGTVNMTVTLSTRTVTIGTTGDYSTWANWNNSSEEDYAEHDTVGSLPLTVIFQSGEIHDASRYTNDYFRGTWDNVASSLTVTSEGFTGIPYGETGGNGTYFRCNHVDKLTGHGSTAGSFGTIKWTEIEIDCPTTNGGHVGTFTFRYSSGIDFIADRCIFRSYTSTNNICGLFLVRDYCTSGSISITNNLFYDISSTGTGCGAVLYYVSSSGNPDHLVKFLNNTVVKAEVDEATSFVIRTVKALDTDIKNNVIQATGTNGGILSDNSLSEGNVLQDASGSASDVNSVDVYTAAGNTSDVYTDVDGFDFSHKVGGDAIGVATGLTIAESGGEDEVPNPGLDGQNRIDGAASWDAGATVYNTA